MTSNKLSTGSSANKSKIKRTKRHTSPAHFILKIKSFTQLLEFVKETRDNKYESDEFEAADYKWKMVLYPNGNKKRNVEGHMSMYIASTDKRAISNGCHVNALVNLFVYDHIRDKYLTIQDGKIKRYHVVTEHGYDQLLSLEKFNDVSNGYLDNDCCVFGAEVHVIQNTVKVSEFPVTKDLLTNKDLPNPSFTWKIDRFTTLQFQCPSSETFDASGFKWNLKLFPSGGSVLEEGRYMSLHINCQSDVATGLGVNADCKMLIRDQILGNHHERSRNFVFRRSYPSLGYLNFIPLRDVHDASKGFLVNDTLVIEVKITAVSCNKSLVY